MKVTLTIFLIIVFLALAAASCAPKATDEDLKKMCAHLAELRSGKNIETDIDECIAKAKAESVSKRQALCRISASNTQEYFVRCRTGEAR